MMDIIYMNEAIPTCDIVGRSLLFIMMKYCVRWNRTFVLYLWVSLSEMALFKVPPISAYKSIYHATKERK